VVFVVGLAIAQIARLQTTYTITNQRLTIQTGLRISELTALARQLGAPAPDLSISPQA